MWLLKIILISDEFAYGKSKETDVKYFMWYENYDEKSRPWLDIPINPTKNTSSLKSRINNCWKNINLFKIR